MQPGEDFSETSESDPFTSKKNVQPKPNESENEENNSWTTKPKSKVKLFDEPICLTKIFFHQTF